MLIAEITIVGLMALKKAAIATPLMIPLIIVTILFNGYIRQQHFRVTEALPSKECLKMDMENKKQRPNDFEFVKDAYIQEEMRDKEAFPDDLPEGRAEALGLVSTNDDVETAPANEQPRDPLSQPSEAAEDGMSPEKQGFLRNLWAK